MSHTLLPIATLPRPTSTRFESMESDERFAILERSIADEKIAAANMKTTLDDLLKCHTKLQNLPTTHPVHVNPVVSSSQPVTTSSCLKPRIPSDFDGD
jgi:hypothetical protein